MARRGSRARPAARPASWSCRCRRPPRSADGRRRERPRRAARSVRPNTCSTVQRGWSWRGDIARMHGWTTASALLTPAFVEITGVGALLLHRHRRRRARCCPGSSRTRSAAAASQSGWPSAPSPISAARAATGRRPSRRRPRAEGARARWRLDRRRSRCSATRSPRAFRCSSACACSPASARRPCSWAPRPRRRTSRPRRAAARPRRTSRSRCTAGWRSGRSSASSLAPTGVCMPRGTWAARSVSRRPCSARGCRRLDRRLRPSRPRGAAGLLHPAALRPGLILMLSTTGYAGFAAFVPLYVTELGLSGVGLVFAEYAFAVLVVRIFGARLPDRLGSRRGASIALALQIGRAHDDVPLDERDRAVRVDVRVRDGRVAAVPGLVPARGRRRAGIGAQPGRRDVHARVRHLGRTRRVPARHRRLAVERTLGLRRGRDPVVRRPVAGADCGPALRRRSLSCRPRSPRRRAAHRSATASGSR